MAEPEDILMGQDTGNMPAGGADFPGMYIIFFPVCLYGLPGAGG